ncbi:MAG: sulfotransferase [Bacteroidota bacterium]
MKSNEKKQIDFFIVGAAKAGSTSIYQYLKQHPGIYLPPIKELNFFSDDIRRKNFRPEYAKSVYLDVDAYLNEGMKHEVFHGFIEQAAQHEKLFEPAKPGQLAGELSNTYLYSETAAQNIFKYNPKSKIIMLLRNPVERAFSHYQMDLRSGLVHNDFITEFNNDRHKIPKGWGISNLYYELGLYYEQAKRYFDLFPREQIHIILFDDLLLDKVKTMQALSSFLNIDDKFQFNLETKFNEAAMPRNKFVLWLKKRKNISRFFKSLIPAKLFSLLKEIAFSKKHLPEITAEEKQTVFGYYHDDLLKLTTLIRRDLSRWMKN